MAQTVGWSNIFQSWKSQQLWRCYFEIDGITVNLVSLYAPNGASMWNLDSYPNCNCIIGGDLNNQLDSTNIYDQSKTSLCNMIQENELIDTWRYIENKPGYTFYHNVIKRPSRIDYVLVSETLGYQLKEISVDSSGLSDHSAVIVRSDYQTIPMEKEDGFVIMNFLKTSNVKLELNGSGNSGLLKKTVTIVCLVGYWKKYDKRIIKDYEGEKIYKEKTGRRCLKKGTIILLAILLTIPELSWKT